MSSDVIMAAFGAMANVFICSIVGVYIASYPKGNVIFPATCMQQISRVCNEVFLPFLIMGSMASAITAHTLVNGLVLILFSTVSNIIGLMLGTLLEGFHNAQTDAEWNFARAVTIACGTPNQLSLPIMVLWSMCGSRVVNADYNDDKATCSNEAMSLLFVYSIGFQLVFWGYSFPVLEGLVALRRLSVDERSSGGAERGDIEMVPSGGNMEAFTKESAVLGESDVSDSAWGRTKQTAWRVLNKSFLNVNMLAQYVGVALALIPSVQKTVFKPGGDLSFIGDTIQVLGSPLVAVNCLVMAGSLTLTKATYSLEYFGLGWLSSLWHSPEIEKDIEGSKDTRACGEGDVCEAQANAKEGEVEIEVKEGGAALTTAGTGDDDDRPSLRSVVIHCLVRLLVMPCITLGLLHGALRVGLVGQDDHLIQLIIVVEGGAPSAQMMLVALNQLGLQDVAGKLAFLYVPQYLISIFSITFWTTIGADMIYN